MSGTPAEHVYLRAVSGTFCHYLKASISFRSQYILYSFYMHDKIRPGTLLKVTRRTGMRLDGKYWKKI